MTWIIKKFIKDSENTTDHTVRKQYTYFAGTVGMIVNFSLFSMKLAVGLAVGSVAIIADGFNNLSDMLSSAVTVVGIKLSQLPADKEHPYGHGRFEYIAALIVAFLVMMVGFQLGQHSFTRILHPQSISFDLVSFILLFVSVFAKWWLSRFNVGIGAKINSAPLKAAGVDSLGDVLISGTVLLSFAIAPFLSYSIDGWAGLIVAVFIICMGFKLIQETISPLLGEAPNKEIVDGIMARIKTYPYVIGAHDLHFHNYGVGRVMLTMHVEFAGCNDLLEIHDILDLAEREISHDFDVHLVIHMDPVSKLSDEAKEIHKHVVKYITQNKEHLVSVHDFRVLKTSDVKTIAFDLDVNANNLTKSITEESIRAQLHDHLRSCFKDYEFIIAVDRQYVEEG
ncbi:MAG: cation diffusion facilitator family transporter [Turicibacter sp.]|nr:cation diffusion facilitator family transporter [Turicibacter sp.]